MYVAGFFSVYSRNFSFSTPEQLKTEVTPILSFLSVILYWAPAR